MVDVCSFCNEKRIIVARHSCRLRGFVKQPICYVCFNQLSRCSDGLRLGENILELIDVGGRGIIVGGICK